MSFSSLGLSPEFLRALSRLGFDTPTPIQSAVIPVLLQGQDLIASARTGTGKTLAYGLPLLQALSARASVRPRHPRALVLVPTRELAMQVGEVLRELSATLTNRPKIHVFFGGVSINPQLISLRTGTDLVVATSGRLLDLIAHNALRLDAIETMVLDEADRLLDAGFALEMAQIFQLLPPKKQMLLFSATYSQEVKNFAATFLNAPALIELAQQGDTALCVAHRALHVDTEKRTQLLRHWLQTEHAERVLVFVATKHACEIVADKLRKAGIDAEPFHGELSQGKRSQVLADFKAARLRVVVATDVASRGLDIAELPLVVNYDLPRSPADFTHRIGRTGRAGAQGLAISFVSAATQAHFQLIQKRCKLAISLEVVAGFEPIQTAPTTAESAHDSHGGIKGKRPNKKDKLRRLGQL